MYYFANNQYYIPAPKEMVESWISDSNKIGWRDTKPAVWIDGQDMYILTHGTTTGQIVFDSKMISLPELAKNYGDEIAALGIKHVYTISCHTYFQRPCIYKGIEFRPILVSYLEFIIETGYVTPIGTNSEVPCVVATVKADSRFKFIRKMKKAVAYYSALWAVNRKPKVIE